MPSADELHSFEHLTCPYCWESYDIFVDYSAGDHQYVEDCRVCCHPILIRALVDYSGEAQGIECEREND